MSPQIWYSSAYIVAMFPCFGRQAACRELDYLSRALLRRAAASVLVAHIFSREIFFITIITKTDKS